MRFGSKDSAAASGAARRGAAGDSGTADWHSIEPELLGRDLGADLGAGLDVDEVQRRQSAGGFNEYPQRPREGPLGRFFEELREPLILLLLLTGVLYSVWGERVDAVTIFAVIGLLIASEIFNEWRAERAIDALASLNEPTAVVRRGGHVCEVEARELVRGDIVIVGAGQRIAADLRLLESSALSVDESALTGESLPVAKQATAQLAPGTPIADRVTMVHAGTSVLHGQGIGVVVAIGPRTEFGQIVHLAAQAEPPKTPLQRSMAEISRSLIGVALALSAVVPLLSVWLADQGGRDAALTGFSLAFATIPEEMPILLTMALGLGGYRMARRRAIVRRLPAIETLGAVTMVLTDKTGTLTQNRLAVSTLRSALPDQVFLARLGETVIGSTTHISDPIDRAIEAATPAATEPVAEFAFDRDRRRSCVVHNVDSQYRVSVKGAVEAVLEISDRYLDPDGTETAMTSDTRARLLAEAESLGSTGARVLAVAAATRSAIPTSPEEAERDLCLLGLIALADPVRAEAPAAVAACARAGIDIVMVTGDHAATAKAIATVVGINTSPVINGTDLDALDDTALRDRLAHGGVVARAAPAQKLQLVRALQGGGEVIAVTGDGINDAPALAAADVGVSMGIQGTDIARDAADLVLADDNFATLESGIEEGRALHANLRKAVRFYLAAKVALLTTVLAIALAGLTEPFTPIQIIVMELFMDLAASAAFVAEAPEADLMDRDPIDTRRRFLDPTLIRGILTAGLSLFAAVTSAYLATRALGSPDQAPTVAFITWQLGHVMLAFHLRSDHTPLTRLGLTTNRVMLTWAAAVIALVAALLVWSPLRDALHIVAIDPHLVGLSALAAIAGSAWIEISKHATHPPAAKPPLSPTDPAT